MIRLRLSHWLVLVFISFLLCSCGGMSEEAAVDTGGSIDTSGTDPSPLPTLPPLMRVEWTVSDEYKNAPDLYVVNVYWGARSQEYSEMAVSRDLTGYTFESLPPGRYYMVVTLKELQSGLESLPSNEIYIEVTSDGRMVELS